MKSNISNNPECKKIFVKRSPLNFQGYSAGGYIKLKDISDIKWDNKTGGYKTTLSKYYLFGYIDYDLATEVVDCSGKHKDYGNSVKVFICKCKSDKDIYNKLLKSAGPCPNKSPSKPCTKSIIKIIQQCEIDRQTLRKKLKDLGYTDSRIRQAIKKMNNDGRIICIGSSYSGKQIIKLNTNTNINMQP